ncbi:DUF134 domain-containing protein [Vallitalea pronyensis]|uniref:UPF0251 protein HZI73_10490 n=1 Tax=Vallitalea pronyensis TaxID=1348613 RepID=A0A8J8MJ91_9FIRM|nr:DUF134 domain-containing protein [Vallitalea pronyensis]QUI22695.1 DUF134 domain-containing protein [Vallitalea pronyensis]
MPRPKKCRRVDFFPEHTYFKPRGIPMEDIEEMILNLEELEAMRLKDIEGLNQEQCAVRMQVSRQTFQNIIDSARQKVAEALTQGKAIHITGGIYASKECKVKCVDCHHEYTFEVAHKRACPKCQSTNIYCYKKDNVCNRRVQKSDASKTR